MTIYRSVIPINPTSTVVEFVRKIDINMDDEHFLSLAVKQAEISVDQGGFPAGAVVVKDGEIIAKGISLGFKLHDPTSHAETESIREACQKLQTSNLSGATLYASLEPCLMCFSGANWAGISRIVYGCKKTTEMVNKQYYEGSNDIQTVNQQNTRSIKLTYIPSFESQMLKLIKEWEKQFSQGE